MSLIYKLIYYFTKNTWFYYILKGDPFKELFNSFKNYSPYTI